LDQRSSAFICGCSRFFAVKENAAGIQFSRGVIRRSDWRLRAVGSGHLVMVLRLELLLNALHFVFETQLELLKSNFLYFFFFGEKTLGDEGIKFLGVLRMLLGETTEFIVAFEELRSEFRRSHL
jgi:hypothetical protein